MTRWTATPEIAGLPPCSLPRGLLRHLLSPRYLGTGCRVLDVGSPDDGVVGVLRFLGLRVDSLDPANLDRHSYPRLTSAVSDDSYDLILARDLTPYQNDLCGQSALEITAALLGRIAPGGRLSIVLRQSSDARAAQGHLRSCGARHFAGFPGLTQITFFADSWRNMATWQWLAGRGSRSGQLAATFQLPDHALSPQEWRAVAEEAAARHASPCCPWASARTEAPHKSMVSERHAA